MTEPAIAAGVDAIDPAWITAALRASGALPTGTVVALDVKPVGNGLVGDSFRLAITYDGAPASAPASVVGKFAAADPASRATGAAFNLYGREVGFYRELAASVGIITPKTHFARIDPETAAFTLIFEDFGPARAGDQLTGCSIADARTAMLEAAALHAPRWNDPSLKDIAWLTSGADMYPAIIAALPGIITAFRERYDGILEDDHMALVTRLPEIMGQFQGASEGPFTIQHGDFRLDNILFDIQGGARRMGTLDWQTLAIGHGMTDVTYFLSAGVSPEVRRANERELVAAYHDELRRLGVSDYSANQCWADYRRMAVHGVFMGVFSAIAVERTERGDALFLTMTRGACAQALDHDTFDLWTV
ncbi:MAG: ecdysteroid 22-kinase family protein [Caulobacter sp.]|nr:ecdysteroid 22-kinase family protein [Caulobacter sp.]